MCLIFSTEFNPNWIISTDLKNNFPKPCTEILPNQHADGRTNVPTNGEIDRSNSHFPHTPTNCFCSLTVYLAENRCKRFNFFYSAHTGCGSIKWVLWPLSSAPKQTGFEDDHPLVFLVEWGGNFTFRMRERETIVPFISPRNIRGS